MKKTLFFAAILTSLVSCNNSVKNNDKEINLTNNIDSASYALGVNIGGNLFQQFSEVNVDIFKSGLVDALDTNILTLISNENCQQVLQSYFMQKQLQDQEKLQAESLPLIEKEEKFLTENGKRENVVSLKSGLQYEVMNEGSGPKPKLEDKVTTHYHGMLLDGTVFDSSVDRGEPASFPVNGVIPGWTEALQLMSVGSKWKLYVPYKLGYGERGAGPNIGPYTTLIFEVELISIN
jgi:FKBP-type peptidyl-prolyl cis-trans isomerase FklB